MKVQKTTIRCDMCGKEFEWEEPEGCTSTDYMPDGYFVPNYDKGQWDWICDSCGSCPTCGGSLEKEPEKRGPHARPCRDCEGDRLHGKVCQ